MPKARSPRRDISTSVKDRAHVSMRPVSSIVSASAALQRRPKTPARVARARVINRTIRSIAITPQKEGLDAERVSVLAIHYNARAVGSGDPIRMTASAFVWRGITARTAIFNRHLHRVGRSDLSAQR